jgi:hypothetical protein
MYMLYSSMVYRKNLPYKFNNSYDTYGDVQNRNFEKSHRTTDPGQMTDLRTSKTGFVILGKLRSKNDLRQHRNRKILGDDQGCRPDRRVWGSNF